MINHKRPDLSVQQAISKPLNTNFLIKLIIRYYHECRRYHYCVTPSLIATENSRIEWCNPLCTYLPCIQLHILIRQRRRNSHTSVFGSAFTRQCCTPRQFAAGGINTGWSVYLSFVPLTRASTPSSFPCAIAAFLQSSFPGFYSWLVIDCASTREP